MNRQNGSALIISLLILLVMTMLGITVMSTSTLEEKMAANDRSHKVSFENAELTLTQAEESVLNGAIGDGDTGYYDKTVDDETVDYFDTGNWVADDTCAGINNNQSGNHACYIVEKFKHQPPLEQCDYTLCGQQGIAHDFMKVTARSAGSNNTSAAMVQSTLRKNILPGVN
jgi:type IV pilus assembly protein PilX